MRLGWLALVSTAGCGLISGLDNLDVGDGGVADVTSADGASDAGLPDVSLDVGACEAGTCGAPAGFQPLFFTSNRQTACPSDTTSVDVVVDPSAPQNACQCECNYQPSCLPQANSFQWGLSNCATSYSGGQLDGGCNGTNVSLGGTSVHLAMGPFPPTNTCTNALKQNSNPSAPPGRLCTNGDCSSCNAPPGFSMCFAKEGDAQCPTGFTKHAVGTSAALSCSACTACKSTATCAGTLKMFSDDQCGTLLGTLNVDGTCQGFSSSNVKSVKYNPNVDNGVCTPGTSTSSVALTTQLTVCCP